MTTHQTIAIAASFAVLYGRWDPAYLDIDDCEQPEAESVRPSEFEVRDA